MSTIAHQQQLNIIYQSLSELNVLELDNVMHQILNLRKQKLPSILSDTETEILKKINTQAPKEIQKRYNVLLNKRKKETLKEFEYQELLELTSYMENLNVQRVELLIELAKIRNISLDEVIEQLGLKPQLYVGY